MYSEAVSLGMQKAELIEKLKGEGDY